MDRLRFTLVVAMVGFFAVLAPSPAQAYPGFTCTISDVSVVGGEDVHVTASVDPQVEVDFEMSYLGQTHTDNGVSSTTATFETSEVDDSTATTVFATATTQEGSVPCSGTITLLPSDDDDNDDDDDDGHGGSDDGDNGGLLPNTGGERLAWLLIGGLLVLVGGGLVVASRRSRRLT